MSGVAHPLADEWTEEYSLYASSISRVSYSAPLRGFLGDCIARGVRPVVLTDAGATVSSHAAAALRRAGGVWAVRAGDAVYDALSGFRIRSIPDLWNDASTDRERLTEFLDPATDRIGSFFFDVYARERAVEQTRIGSLADAFVSGLGGWGFDRWGLDEPLASAWDHEMFTASLRAQMPASEPHLLASPDRAFASVSVARTRTGLLEHAAGAVPAGPYGSPIGLSPGAPLASHPRITTTLTTLAERHRPNVAMVSYVEYAPSGVGLGQRARWRHPDQPLAVLIGPRAVRDLGVDIDDLQTRHDVTAVGLTRAPSLLVRLSGPDRVWAQLAAFTYDLDQERLAAALAVDFQSGA